MLGSEKNRLHKILESAGIKLGAVVSDIDGVSAREMIAAIIKESHTPEEIAEMARGRLKSKKSDLVRSLKGRLSDRHRFLLKKIQNHMKWLENHINEIDSQVEKAMIPYKEEWQLLQTIPGVDKTSAAMLLSEIGVNMNCFGNKDRLSSWAGMCPGNNQSANKKKSGRTRHGDKFLKSVLCEIANSARKTNGQYKAMYQGLVIRRGHKRTIVAIGHKVLEVVFVLLKKKVPCQDSLWCQNSVGNGLAKGFLSSQIAPQQAYLRGLIKYCIMLHPTDFHAILYHDFTSILHSTLKISRNSCSILTKNGLIEGHNSLKLKNPTEFWNHRGFQYKL